MGQLTERIDDLLEAAMPRLSDRELRLVGDILMIIEDEKFNGNIDKFYRWISKSTDEFLEELWAYLENHRGANRKKLTSLPADAYIWIHGEYMLG